MVVFGQGGCNRRMCFFSIKAVVFRQEWLYSGKSGCIRAKVVAFGHCGCIWAKVVIFLQSGCIQAKWLYSENVVLFGQSGCIRAKVVVFKQRWFYCGNSCCIRAEGLYSSKSDCFRTKIGCT